MSKDELILLAHLIGDGCILPRKPYHYTSADMANIEMVQTAARNLFDIESRIVKQENWWHVYLTSPYHLTHGVKHPITLWYERLGIERVRSYDKKLPASLFQCDDTHIALFLKHLWATDGNVSWKPCTGGKMPAIYYSSTSLLLIQQVQHLLLRLGIQTNITQIQKGTYKITYILMVKSHVVNVRLFLNLVNCYGKRGDIASSMLDELKDVQSYPLTDMIPKEIWKEEVIPLLEQKNIKWKILADAIGTKRSVRVMCNYNVFRDNILKMGEVLDSEDLRNLANSDILWDEITSITPLGVEDVYDATVEGVHNFIANDIILHNSIEQDADMVMFLYRPEYYGLTQDSNGNPTAGMAEVIVAKHRNGGLGDVQLRFKGKYTKFENPEPEHFRLNSIATNGLESFESGANIISSLDQKKQDPNSQGNNLEPNDEVPF